MTRTHLILFASIIFGVLILTACVNKYLFALFLSYLLYEVYVSTIIYMN